MAHEILELTLTRPAAGGGFVARDDDGRVVFVRHGLPGERVLAVVTEEHARWRRADTIEVLEASPQRVAPPCPHAGPGGCGGCDYQHASLDAQRSFKAQLLAEQLRRIAGLDLDVSVEAFSTTGLGTRTRVRYGTTPEGHLGMRRRASHEVIEVDRCPLGVAAISDLELGERSWPPGDDVQVVALGDDEPLVVLVEWGDDEPGDVEATPLEDLDDDAWRWAEVGGHLLRVSPDSFFQIHLAAPAALVETVLEGLLPEEGDVVLDLYAGVGLFSVALAERLGPTGRVVAVESSPAAAGDARANLEGLSQAQVVEEPVSAKMLEPFLRHARSAVLDPPRAGVDARALAAIAESSLERVVLVSCEPATFARDLKVLLSAGWQLESLRAFDLFEMTEHLEVVAALSH